MENQLQSTLINSSKIILPSSKITCVKDFPTQALNELFINLQNCLGCTYVLYFYEDSITDKKIIYCSNWKWQQLLINEKLINSCPIFRAANEGLKRKDSIILPWNHIPAQTSIEKEVTLLRSEFNIANGIGISFKSKTTREGLGMGADVKDINFYRRLTENNLIYHILKKIRLLSFRSARYSHYNKRILN